MAAPRMERTRHPGIYKRGSRYVVTYRVNGKQRKESARTLDEARRIKSSRTTDRDRGEFQAESRIPFREYAEEWIDRYRGNGKRGFTENTREHYRRDLARRAYPFFDERLGRTISEITPRDVDRWIAWLCDEREQGKRLADATIRRTLAPLRSCLATARREGLIRHNPANEAVLPSRDEQADGETTVRVLTRGQLGKLLAALPESRRLLFRFLAATGLRWSELVGLRWRDLDLDGDSPVAQVRRAIVPRLGRKGDESPWTVKPPKSKHGKRSIPLDATLARELRAGRHTRNGLALTTSYSLPGTVSRCDTATCAAECSGPRHGRPASRGLGCTRCATPVRRCCSRQDGTRSRFNTGSGTTRPRSRSIPTRTCSMRAWAWGSTSTANSPRLATEWQRTAPEPTGLSRNTRSPETSHLRAKTRLRRKRPN